jgi:phosphoglycolate phosphatase
MKEIGLIFDLDGTLLDTLGDLQDAVNYALSQVGLPERGLGEIRRFVGNGARNLITQAVEGRAEVDEVLSIFQKYYADHCQSRTAPYDGALQALEQLMREYPVAIVSNKPDGAVKSLCNQYFPGVFALGETPDCPRKPAPDMVWKAMEVLDVKSGIYIGDSEVDVITARNAGMPCVSVLWGFRDREEIEMQGGSHFCEHPQQLPEMIEKIAGEYNVQ